MGRPVSQPLPRYTDWRARDEQALAAALLETGEPAPTAKTMRNRNLQADPRVLRAIPVQAFGVGGAVPGSRPDYVDYD